MTSDDFRASASSGSLVAASGLDSSLGAAHEAALPPSIPELATRTTADPNPVASSPPLSDDGLPVLAQRGDPKRYQILSEYGRGGLGRVYRARDNDLGRDVALKELLQPTYRSEVRFLREAFLTARLEHPAIVPVHEAGRWPDGTPYYAMKLVAGRPLFDLLANAKTIDQRLALLPHLIAVADAIAYAHDRKIIHRDLKPSNVIVGDFGETIVIDWGLAKEVTADDDEIVSDPYRVSPIPELTAAGSVMGTPNYMSPEQARGDRVDARTDVYALGAMLFELCTGTVPPANATRNGLRRDLRRIPEDLATIALKSLSSISDDRYPDAAAFAADLRAYDAGVRIAARKYSLVAILGHWIRHHKRLALSIAIPTAIAAGIGVLSLREVVLQRDRASSTQRQAEAERRAAERERDRAIRSQAALLLEKDPTKARDLLASRDALAPDEALLMARAQGAGLANHIVSLLPYKIHDALLDDEFKTLAVSASDNKLRIVDLTTGNVKVVDDGLLEPTLLVREVGGLTYARRGNNGPEIIRATNSKKTIPLRAFQHDAYHPAVASAPGLYLLAAKGDLVRISPTGEFRSVAQGIRGVWSYRDGLLACTSTHLLRIAADNTAVRIGRCNYEKGSGAFATNGNDYVVQADSSTVVLQRNGVRSSLSIRGLNRFVMAAKGLVVGTNNMDRTWYLSPGADEVVYGPPSESMPTAIGADGSLAAWGYMDGVVRVRETRSGATWTFVGHPAPIGWMFVSERLRIVVTVGGPEVRIWRIPTFSLRPIGTLTCGVFSVASSHDGKRIAFGCGNGIVSLALLCCVADT